MTTALADDALVTILQAVPILGERHAQTLRVAASGLAPQGQAGRTINGRSPFLYRLGDLREALRKHKELAAKTATERRKGYAAFNPLMRKSPGKPEPEATGKE